MKILTHKNVIAFVGEISHGIFPEADPEREVYRIAREDGTTAYAAESVFNFVDVAQVPDEVVPDEWCYTEAEGFYRNPDWRPPEVVPPAPPEPTADEILDALLGVVE